MKKISFYLIAIVAVSSLVVFSWVYVRYIRKTSPNIITTSVTRGPIREGVKVRGEVAAQKEFALGFPFSGTVETTYAAEGTAAAEGASIMKLETTDYEIQKRQLGASVTEAQANLDKLRAGATSEDIAVSQTKYDASRTALFNGINDAYTVGDDAAKNKAKQYFDIQSSSGPHIAVEFQTSEDLNWKWFLLGKLLGSWKVYMDGMQTSGDPGPYASEADKNLRQIKTMIDDISDAINTATEPQPALDTLKATLSASRTTLNSQISALAAARSGFDVAEDELALIKAPARSEDIEAAKADLQSAQAQLDLVLDKIRKSTLSAPANGTVTKVWLERGETFSVGGTAVSFIASGYKLQADVSELDIGKLQPSNDAEIKLDAFPGEVFRGKLVSIEPQPVLKDSDKYYRINVSFDTPNSMIVRNGMSADLNILIASKENALKIPELAVISQNGKKMVRVLENGKQKDVEVETGISDGESIEIVKGLEEGEAVLIPTE